MTDLKVIFLVSLSLKTHLVTLLVVVQVGALSDFNLQGLYFITPYSYYSIFFHFFLLSNYSNQYSDYTYYSGYLFVSLPLPYSPVILA